MEPLNIESIIALPTAHTMDEWKAFSKQAEEMRKRLLQYSASQFTVWQLSVLILETPHSIMGARAITKIYMQIMDYRELL